MNRGIGFAVPINLAKEVGENLIDSGKFTRTWLGIGIADLSSAGENARLVSGVTEGVLVTSILPGGPSAHSELEPADVIVAVDGKSTPTAAQLKSEIRHKPIGESVTLNVVRGEKPERWVRQTDFANDEAVGYLSDRLARLGVEDALRAAGAEPGDEIVVGGDGGVVFDWEPSVMAGAEMLGRRGEDHRLEEQRPAVQRRRDAVSGRQGSEQRVVRHMAARAVQEQEVGPLADRDDLDLCRWRLERQ